MTASQTGAEGAVERIEGSLTDNRSVIRYPALNEDLRTLLADHAALTARIAALEGEREKDARSMRRAYEQLWDTPPRSDVTLAKMHLRPRLAARQSREETGDRT